MTNHNAVDFLYQIPGVLVCLVSASSLQACIFEWHLLVKTNCLELCCLFFFCLRTMVPFSFIYFDFNSNFSSKCFKSSDLEHNHSKLVFIRMFYPTEHTAS